MCLVGPGPFRKWFQKRHFIRSYETFSDIANIIDYVQKLIMRECRFDR